VPRGLLLLWCEGATAGGGQRLNILRRYADQLVREAESLPGVKSLLLPADRIQ
jgi:hypothetical protein